MMSFAVYDPIEQQGIAWHDTKEEAEADLARLIHGVTDDEAKNILLRCVIVPSDEVPVAIGAVL